MAEHSLRSADYLLTVSEEIHSRSAVSRSYYSAYQAATSLLHAAGNTPPTIDGRQRESWNHAETPDIMLTSLKNLPINQKNRSKVRSILGQLYKLRVDSDYVATEQIMLQQAGKAKREAGFILKIAQSIIERDKL